MTASGWPSFFGRPPLWRVGVLLVLGLGLAVAAHIHSTGRRPPELSAELAEAGNRKVREVLEIIGESEYGRSTRGAILTAKARAMMEDRRIRFSPNLPQEALCWKEWLREPVLYISVFFHKDRVSWPPRSSLAERIYHEALHAVVGGNRPSRQEECDAFCAAEEAAAAVSGRIPQYPVMRDGKTVWTWVSEVYTESRSFPKYEPVGCAQQELAARTGCEFVLARARSTNTSDAVSF